MRSATVALLLALTWVRAPSASADQLMLSRDGVTWQSNLTGGIFVGSGPWVPGETRTGHFLVRNTTGTDGVLSVELTGPAGADITHRLSVRARIDGGAWTRRRDLPFSSPLRIGTVPAHADELVQLRLTLDAASKDAVADSTAPLRIVLRLRQAWASPGVIPQAGAPALRPWVLLGGLLTGLGCWLVAGRRGRREEQS